jgi:hypothetical protein
MALTVVARRQVCKPGDALFIYLVSAWDQALSVELNYDLRFTTRERAE